MGADQSKEEDNTNGQPPSACPFAPALAEGRSYVSKAGGLPLDLSCCMPRFSNPRGIRTGAARNPLSVVPLVLHKCLIPIARGLRHRLKRGSLFKTPLLGPVPPVEFFFRGLSGFTVNGAPAALRELGQRCKEKGPLGDGASIVCTGEADRGSGLQGWRMSSRGVLWRATTKRPACARCAPQFPPQNCSSRRKPGQIAHSRH